MGDALKHALFGVALATTLAASAWLAPMPPEPRFAAKEYQPAPATRPEPLFERHPIDPPPGTLQVHSGTLVEVADGGLLAAWFGGSREGAADVAIQGARWDPRRGWGDPFVILDRQHLERRLGRTLRKLGNPVLWRHPDGRIWLWVVTSGLGGWSTSSLVLCISPDQGHTWGPPRPLVTSPFLNISTLARGRPLDSADGGVLLPVYHELAGKFGELLRLDAQGHILAKSRISAGRAAIQPSLVASGPDQARAFLRRTGTAPAQVLSSNTQDGGYSWSPLAATTLPNPDAAVAALGTPAGHYLLVYNGAPDQRGRLDLARSLDGDQWRHLWSLEQGDAPDDEFSYPYLIRSQAGDYQLIYTWQRRRMVHIRFNDAWLEQRP